MSDTQPTQTTEPKAEVSGSFIYETEHPQLALPFTARVGDRRVEGKSISITHAVVSGLMPPNGNFEKVPTSLQFNFEGFSVNLFVEVNVEKIGDAENPDLRLQFCDPAGSHLPTLRYIMNSHLAGDLVTVGRFLGYTGPTQVKTKPPAAKPGTVQRVARTIRQGGILALSLVLIGLAANVVHERIMFQYEGRPVVIAQSGETLRATTAGQITYVNEDAGLGDVVYSVAANSGSLLSVRMPCDCTILPGAEFFEGATVLAGAPLVTLTEDSAAIEASALVSFEGIARMMAGDTPQLEFSDGRILPVSLEVTETADTAQANAAVPVQVILPEENIDQVAIGDTARLRFKRNILPEGLQQTIWGSI
ncbi:hypothetical protein [Yoonia sp. BS5-3]|uniref:HlyD family secretion protein n=1 Tax=Yoonia phaeophyticola TaxID=3137369 RepID=A0ABZ2V8Z6_9RHOB